MTFLAEATKLVADHSSVSSMPSLPKLPSAISWAMRIRAASVLPPLMS